MQKEGCDMDTNGSWYVICLCGFRTERGLGGVPLQVTTPLVGENYPLPRVVRTIEEAMAEGDKMSDHVLGSPVLQGQLTGVKVFVERWPVEETLVIER